MPTPSEVADRVVALKCCVVYALGAPPREVVSMIRTRSSGREREAFEDKAEESRYAFWNPIEDTPVYDALTEKERALAESTIASMTAEQQVEASWWIESVAVLAWALGLVPELPPWDRQVEHGVLEKVPGPLKLEELRGRAMLRRSEELERARAAAEMWHWRARTLELQRSGFKLPPELAREGVKSLDDIVRLTTAHAAVEKVIARPVEDDFPARGGAYHELDEEAAAELRSIAAERHRALEWVCGRVPSWDAKLPESEAS